MAGDENLGVSQSRLREVSTSVGSLADELAHELRAVDGEVSGFVGAGWTGLSSGAFAESFWEWHEGAMDVHAGLIEMAALLNAAAGDYEAQDHGSAALLDTQMNLDG